MKKSKTLLALLLTLAFAGPLAIACKQAPAAEGSAVEAPVEPPVAELPNQPESPTSPTEPEAPVLPSEPPAVTPPVVTPPVETPVVTPTVKKAEYVKCTGNGVNLRAGAGTEYAVVGSAAKDTNYFVVEKTGDWYKTYYRGKTAYISASYGAVFSLEKTESKVEEVISEGYKLLGVPYVYGAVRYHDGNGKLLSGFTAQKFDCSSLVQYVFYKGAGKPLGLTTRAQVKQGKYVKRADLQRGDCLYFTNEDRQYNTGVERIGHVAIYLGDNYILHTASDYARIEKMSAKRWSFYVEARRFI